ncbi:MAG: SusC/RagA family TonB-linked outer membrane protein, partial [Gemmatimonadetes bacterium]|nr:SusC/RagA family TonB-linked outer membrane protein [Gemmatimonadota bacterium]
MLRKIFLYALALGVLLPASLSAQEETRVTGTVRSDAQTPVAGAVVVIQSLGRSVVTNDYGRYLLLIPADQVSGQTVTLKVSSIGYEDAETSVELKPGTIVVNLTMATKAIALDEVIVTGTAGRTERRVQSAEVSSINSTQVAAVAPITTVSNLLQARTPGLMMRNESGSAGTYTTIRIRGISSISQGNNPLVYVDGIRVDGGSQQIYGLGGQSGSRLNDIKPEDIESIEVVKGPAAATLYGSDAVAGVINIITKKGREGSGITQTINIEYGQSSPNFTPPSNYGVCTSGALSRPTTYPNCVGHQAGDVLIDNPLLREHSFQDGEYRNLVYSLSGGGQNYDMYFSVGADDNQGTLPNNTYNHFTSRGNFGFMARPDLRIEFGFGLARVKTDLPNNDNNIYGYLGGGLLGDPRTIGAARDGWYASNRQSLAIGSIENTNTTWRIQPRTVISYTPFSWFKNRLTVGADMERVSAMSFWAKNEDGWWDAAPMNTGQVSQAREQNDRVTMEYLGSATRQITDDIRADLAVGTQWQSRQYDMTSAQGQGLVSNVVRDIDAAAVLSGGGQRQSKNRDIGFYGQLDLGWRERLYLQAGLRRDQSSVFGIDSKPFYSPKIGFSYVISDEPFFRNLVSENIVSSMRLRSAYGVSGRQPSGGARSTYSPSTNQISATGVAVGVRPRDTGNPDLRPEKTHELEIGADIGLLNDRLGLKATYFHKKGVDQILGLPVPGSLGASGPDVNVGALLNTGFELEGNARVIVRDNLAWEINASLATLKNELLDLGGVPESATRKVGYPLNGNWDYVILNVDQANDRVTVSDSLKYIGMGQNYPGWQTTIASTVTFFRNLSLYAQVDGRGDYYVFDGTTEFRDRAMPRSDVAALGAAAFGTDADGNPTPEAIDMY